jgi:hypothetical protein
MFIDAAVQDAARLAAAARPDVRIVKLSAAASGPLQIAAYLSSQRLQDLAAISIVAHGSNAMLQIGSGRLDAAGIAGQAAAFATLGAALRPGGDIRLYSCGVAASAPGIAFITALSAACGGATVVAASGPVGSAARGATWALDVATGPPPGPTTAPPPFIAARLAAYKHTLQATPVTLFYTADSGADSQDNGLGAVGATGTIGTGITAIDVGFTDAGFAAEGIAIDAARGEYVFAYYPDYTTSTLVLGSLHGGSSTTLTVGDIGLTVGTDFIDGVALDEPAGEIYLAISSNNALNNGIWKLSEAGGTATAVATSSALSNPTELAVDSADGLVFFVDQSVLPAIPPAANNLDVANIANGTIHRLFSGGTAGNDPQIAGLAVDAADHTLYYTTHDANDDARQDTIIRATYTIAAGGAVALTQTTTLYAGLGAGEPFGISLDVPDGVFYVQNGAGKNIDEGSLTGAFPLTPVSNSTIADDDVTTSGEPEFLAIDVAPGITAGGTVTFVQGGAAVAADATATDSNPNGQDQEGATVHISAGTFSGDQDSLAATTTGTAINAHYDATTETLTLTGVDTEADYAQVLDSVSFRSTSTNPSDSGADLTRTLSWTVTDGINASTAATSVIDIQTTPTVVAGATAHYVINGAPVLADPTLTVTDYSSATLTGASVQFFTLGNLAGDTLSDTPVAGITALADGNLLLLSGTASVADYQTALDSVTYSSTAADPTDGGTDPTRVLEWAVYDNGLESPLADSTVDLACFLAGTRLLGERGPVAVESLRPGDRLVVRDGAIETLETVIWVGHRALDADLHPRPEDILPIRIQADAFAPGVPRKNLFVSPDHALLVEGVLVAARQLLNGRTIAQDRRRRRFTYHHVELRRHAILLAEGLAAESYLDTGNRAAFAAGAATILHPDFAATARRATSCAPFVVDAAKVRPIWQRLAARAAALGDDPTLPAWTTAPGLHLRADGRRLAPLLIAADRHIFAVPPGTRDLHLVSRAAPPHQLRPWLDDRRRLGVAVAAIVLERDGLRADLPLDHPALSDGWWGIEAACGRRWRWTDGAARLPPADLIDIRLHEAGRYPIADQPEQAYPSCGAVAW